MGAHFDEAGLSPHANAGMWLKTATITLWLIVSFVLYLMWSGSAVVVVALALSAGLAMAGLGFNVQHDGGHGAYSQSKVVNRAMAFYLDLLGGSSFLWRHKHNVSHHTYPNLVGEDDDIDFSPMARMAPSQPRHWYHRFQQIYMFVLYAFISIKWQFYDDIKEAIGGKMTGQRIVRPRGGEFVIFIVGKILFAAWAVVLPLVVKDIGTALLFFLVSQMTLGVTLAVVFQLAHCVGEVDWPVVAEGERPDWAKHQVETAIDFARDNPFATWYLGGLNFQVVHHLFPKVCHVHYPRIAPIVEAACADHGVRYQARDSALGAIASHYRWLRELGVATPTTD